MKKLLLPLILISVFACNENKSRNESSVEETKSKSIPVSPAEGFAVDIEEAHNKSAFIDKQVVSFDISLTFGGNERMNATVTSLTNSTGIRVDKKDGSSIIFDGENVYITPLDANGDGAKFDIFTWQYFFSLPFKLTDPGTNWELLDSEMVKGEFFNKGKLSFDKNTGDSPDDWYILYQEPDSRLLYGAAYIVTFNKDQKQAEEDPHAIVYHDYNMIAGIPIATKWTFHNWSKENGFEDQIGEAVISNITLTDSEKEMFDKPQNAKKIE